MGVKWGKGDYGTCRSLLSLHSSLLSNLMATTCFSCTQVNISVPLPASILHTLIQILVQGGTRVHLTQGIQLITEAAKVLGIDLELIETKFEENYAGPVSTNKSCHTTNTTKVEIFPSTSSSNSLLPKSEEKFIKHEMPDEMVYTNKQYENHNEESGELFVNEYDNHTESEYDFEFIDPSLTSNDEIKSEMKIHNAEIRAEMKIQSPEDPNHCSYECKFCKKVFANITHLKRHLPSHTGEKRFHCDLCGLKFSRKDNLLIHKRTRCIVLRTALDGSDIVHEEDITCSECGKTFLRGTDYKRHMMNHTGLKPYNCDVCGKGFIQKSRFKTHVESHNIT